MIDTPGQLNGYKIKYIADEAAFGKAVQKLRQTDTLALDLEFDDNRYTYGLTLCLIQIADRETCYLIDPFEIDDLQPLWDIIQNPAVVKIIHSASNDILLLKKLGCVPQNILDTELAAKVLDYARTSFANLMAVIFNIEIDKAFQVSNWNTRPLIEQQLQYAAIDVIYLHALKENLLAEIEKLDRTAWLQEECRLLEKIEQKDQTDRYLRLRGADRLNYYELFLLKRLYDFREDLAFELDKPAGTIIPNEVLVNMAVSPIADYSGWQQIKGMMGRIKDHQTFKHFRQVVQTAQLEAKETGISFDRPPRPRRPDFLVTREEAERRKAMLQPVRSQIIALYGENAASLILPQGVINDFAEGKPLEIKKKYALKIVDKVLNDLQIDIKPQSNLVY